MYMGCSLKLLSALYKCNTATNCNGYYTCYIYVMYIQVLPKLKKGMILINTSRGGLIETEALIEGLRSGTVGGAGLDVYENEVCIC
jgi:D-isomer specific 2-hydroxyacid dehydrogenase, NAD binding domain